jgi:two-component system, cell cycle sensor histidine kinase and response regulator CckA
MKTMLRRVIGEDIELQSDLAGDLKQVYADPGQLEQVILNLAVNARDAMRNGGTIILRTANLRLGVNEVAPQGPGLGDYVRLVVADTGQGMDEATRSRACEPFFTTKAPGEGTGLGLSTVHGIVSQLGGYIDIASEPGRGTTVSVLLPMRAAEDTPEKPTEEAPPPAQGAATVLLVEDEEAVRSITRRALTRQGFSVIEAQNGHEAVKMFRQHADTIDLVLTDLVMPGMGGRELASHLRSASPDVPLLFMSGYAENGLMPDDVDAPFLEKPFTLTQLLSAVSAALAVAPG